MAGPQGRLLLCLLVFYLAGSSILMGQKVSMSQLQGGHGVQALLVSGGSRRACTQIGTGLETQKSGYQCDLP